VLAATGAVREHDGTYVAVAMRMAKLLPATAEVSIVPSAGHAAHLERPDAFGPLLERFVTRVAG